jgi:hypothetical protein
MSHGKNLRSTPGQAGPIAQSSFTNSTIVVINNPSLFEKCQVSKFIVPDWGNKVNSGIGLSYRPARLHRLAGRYDNPMTESTISHNQEL